MPSKLKIQQPFVQTSIDSFNGLVFQSFASEEHEPTEGDITRLCKSFVKDPLSSFGRFLFGFLGTKHLTF